MIQDKVRNIMQGTETAKALVARVKEAQVDALHARLGSKVVHGVHAREMLQQGCDLKATFAWLKSGNLRATTESLIIAAQDGVIHRKGLQQWYNSSALERKGLQQWLTTPRH
jgi:hypothetical protein